MTDPDRPLVLETTTGPGTLDAIQQLLDEAWAMDHLPDLVRMHMELAVAEVGANIIEHSGAGRSVRLRMELRLLPGAVVAKFTDDGHPATIDMSTLDMPDDMAQRGRGLAIAHRVLDELLYRRDADGNHWTLMRKYANE